MTFTAEKARWYEDSDGFWVSLRTKDRAAAAQLSQQMDGKPWTVTAQPKAKRRSLDANAYCWVLLDKLSAALGRSKVELYRECIRDIGGNSQTVCVKTEAAEALCHGWEHNGLGWPTQTMPSKLPGCTTVILYYGSSTYDTRQMSRLINLIVDECRAQGIETKTPDELALMMARWGEQ